MGVLKNVPEDWSPPNCKSFTPEVSHSPPEDRSRSDDSEDQSGTDESSTDDE